MSDKSYKIVFSGEVKSNLDISTAKSNLVLMLDLTPERVNKMFNGQEIVIKRFDKLADAQIRQIKLEKAGVICQIRKQGERKKGVTKKSEEENILVKLAGTYNGATSKSDNQSRFSKLFSSVIERRK